MCSAPSSTMFVFFFPRAHRHDGETSTQPPSLGQKCLCLEGEQTALAPSTPTTRSTATRSKCSTQRPTAGWAPQPHSCRQRDAGVIQPVRHKHAQIMCVASVFGFYLSNFKIIIFILFSYLCDESIKRTSVPF